MRRLLLWGLLVLVLLLVPVAAADPVGVSGPGGYCILVSPADAPFVFLDLSRCDLPGPLPP